MIKKIFILIWYVTTEAWWRFLSWAERFRYRRYGRNKREIPYFNKFKYIQTMKMGEDSDTLRALIADDRSVWWVAMHDEELEPISKAHFKTKKQNWQFSHVTVSNSWIEWRKRR